MVVCRSNATISNRQNKTLSQIFAITVYCEESKKVLKEMNLKNQFGTQKAENVNFIYHNRFYFHIYTDLQIVFSLEL